MKQRYKNAILTHAVLASTLFISPSYATVVNVPNFPAPVQTSIGGDIQITANGAIDGAANANKNLAIIDTNAGKLIIDPNNVNAAAIETTGAATAVAGVTILNPDAIVTVGANSRINGANTKAGSDALIVDATGTNATITNAGIIENTGAGADTGIEFFGASTNGKIINQAGGVIATGPGVLGQTIKQSATASGLSITNAGTIEQKSNDSTIVLNAPFTQMTNQTGGLITQTGGGVGVAAVAILGGGTNDLINEEGATISATKGGVAGIAVAVTNYDGNILNAGKISTIDDPALESIANISGKIVNTGLLTTDTPVLGVVSLFNIQVKGGLTNEGQIFKTNGAGPAVSLAGPNTAVTFNQNGGLITGDVLLAAFDSNKIAGAQNSFHFNDGVITGDVIAPTIAGNTNILDLKGGVLAGNLILGNNGDQVDLSGTFVTGAILGGTGNDIVNVTGGEFVLLDGGAGNNTLNVNATFTSLGPIVNMGNINVNNPGTIFTVNQPISKMNGTGLIIDQGTTMVLNSDISGTGNVLNNGLLRVTGTRTMDLNNTGKVTNNGTTTIDRTSTLTVKSDGADVFLNNPGARLVVGIGGITSPNGTTTNGLLNVVSSDPGAVNLTAGSFLQPTITGFVPEGSKFDVIKANGAGSTILANNTLLQPGSAVVSFSQSLNAANNILTLTSARRPYTVLSSTQVTRGVAGALDVLAEGNGPNSVGLLHLLAELDQLATPEAVEAALESLAPPFNYGLIAGSRVGMDSTFQSVQLRIEDLQARRRAQNNGMSYGDLNDTGYFWAKALGAYLNQKEKGGVAGYKAKGAGGAIGVDWGFNDCTTIGLAASYTKVDVDDKNASPKDQNIKSWQGTAYGWWEFQDGLYLDAMFGIGNNHYRTTHAIDVNTIHTASIASFNGTQWGAQADLGWALCNSENYYIAPFARLKYIHLNVDNFTETGAGDIGLDVQHDHNKEFLGGLGFRLGSTCTTGDLMIVPELTAMIAYDFQNDGEQSLAGFIGGGPAFLTDGIRPGRTIFNLGLGINAHMCEDAIFTVKYDLELRSKFVGNVFYLQYNYLWS